MRLCCRCSSFSCRRRLNCPARKVEILLKEMCRTCNDVLPSSPALQKRDIIIIINDPEQKYNAVLDKFYQ